MTTYSIFDLPLEDRPRERLIRFGSESLSSSELIALILGSGTKERPVLQLAHEIMAKFGSLNKLSEATLAEILEIKGVGPAKALQLKAALSLGLRASKSAVTQKYKVEHPTHAYYLVKDEIENEKREFFVVILLDSKGYAICHEVVSIGSLSNTIVHPREVFYPAIRHKAASIIAAHNHPSGDPTPSPQDIELTKSLLQAGKLMSIPLYDHIIVGQGRYLSLRQQGGIF